MNNSRVKVITILNSIASIFKYNSASSRFLLSFFLFLYNTRENSRSFDVYRITILPLVGASCNFFFFFREYVDVDYLYNVARIEPCDRSFKQIIPNVLEICVFCANREIRKVKSAQGRNCLNCNFFLQKKILIRTGM